MATVGAGDPGRPACSTRATRPVAAVEQQPPEAVRLPEVWLVLPAGPAAERWRPVSEEQRSDAPAGAVEPARDGSRPA